MKVLCNGNADYSAPGEVHVRQESMWLVKARAGMEIQMGWVLDALKIVESVPEGKGVSKI